MAQEELGKEQETPSEVPFEEQAEPQMVEETEPIAEEAAEQEGVSEEAVSEEAVSEESVTELAEEAIQEGEAETPRPTAAEEAVEDEVREEEVALPPQPRVLETGITIHHNPTGSRYVLKATVTEGSGQITISGISIDELLRRRFIGPVGKLLELIQSQRFQKWDIDIDMGGLDWERHIDANVVGYALAEALTNILGRM